MRPTSRRSQVWMILILSGLLTPALEAQERVAFVTSVTGTADLGSWPESGSAVGAAAGDAICRTLAADAGLANAGTFIAWLSTTTDDAYCRLHGFSGKKSANCGQAELPSVAGQSPQRGNEDLRRSFRAVEMPPPSPHQRPRSPSEQIRLSR